MHPHQQEPDHEEPFHEVTRIVYRESDVLEGIVYGEGLKLEEEGRVLVLTQLRKISGFDESGTGIERAGIRDI
jgi:hypothetical protein